VKGSPQEDYRLPEPPVKSGQDIPEVALTSHFGKPWELFAKRFMGFINANLNGLVDICSVFRRHKPQSLVLYVDDIIKRTVIFDFEESIKILVNKRNILKGGKIVLYVKDETLIDSAEKMRDFFQVLSPTTDVIIIQKKDFKQLSADEDNDIKEVEKLVHMLPAKGVDTRNIMAIVKGHEGSCVDYFKGYRLEIPLIMLNFNGLNSDEKGLFCMSYILMESLKSISENYQDPRSWIRIIDPVKKISAEMCKQYQFYVRGILTKA